MELRIRFHYHGTFFTRNRKLLYRKGDVYVSKDVDSDELSKFELESFLKDGTGVVGVKEFWYLEGGKTINDGLHLISTDSDINALVDSVKKDNVAHVYAVLDGEVGPSSILNEVNTDFVLRRSPRKSLTPTPVQNTYVDVHGVPLPTQASCSSYAAKEMLRGKMTLGSSSNVSAEVEKGDNEGFSEVDTDDEGTDDQSILSGADMRFDDSGDEEEDLFEDGVEGEAFGKELTEIVTREFGFAEDVGNGDRPPSDVEEESDGLKTPDDTDNDGQKKRFPEFNQALGFQSPIHLEVGMIFASNEVFRRAISQYSVEKGGDFYYLHNDKTKVNVLCKNKCDCEWKHCRRACGLKKCNTVKCLFRASARRLTADGTFQLKSLQGVHTCGRQWLNSKVTSKYLAEKYIEHYRDDPSMRLSAFKNTVLRDLKVKISASQAMRTRMRAFLMLQGDAKEQYAHSCDYAETLLKYKVASSAYVVCHGSVEKPIFQRFYVCLEACRKGFIIGCRPIIGLDGCHLKGPYNGQILSAVAKDGNENIYPIAYAVVESECKETWGWFMENLFRDLGDMPLCIMSDRQKGLLEALKDKNPMTEQRFCVRHLYMNFIKKYGGGMVLKGYLWQAARATTRVEFDDAMDKMREENTAAADWLIGAGVSAWSKHAFKHFTRSDMLLNNICESWNKFILEARDKPLLTCCEWIRRALMRRFVLKQEGMAKFSGRLTPKASKRLESAKNIGQERCTMWCGGSKRFEVEHDNKTFIVDMNKPDCSCNKWALTGIPCPHACAVIQSTRGMVLEDYVHRYYTMEMYMLAYGGAIESIPGRREWEKSERPQPAPPTFKVQPGRPKKKRRREEGEPDRPKRCRVFTSKQYKCGNCGVAGHTKKRCNYPPRMPTGNTSTKKGGRPRNPNTLDISGNTKSKKKQSKESNANNGGGQGRIPRIENERVAVGAAQIEITQPPPSETQNETTQTPPSETQNETTQPPPSETQITSAAASKQTFAANADDGSSLHGSHSVQIEEEFLWDSAFEMLIEDPNRYRWEDAPVTGSIPQTSKQWKWGRLPSTEKTQATTTIRSSSRLQANPSLQPKKKKI